jgi:hypothetical protein
MIEKSVLRMAEKKEGFRSLLGKSSAVNATGKQPDRTLCPMKGKRPC